MLTFTEVSNIPGLEIGSSTLFGVGGTESPGVDAKGRYLAVCFIEVTEIRHGRLCEQNNCLFVLFVVVTVFGERVNSCSSVETSVWLYYFPKLQFSDASAILKTRARRGAGDRDLDGRSCWSRDQNV